MNTTLLPATWLEVPPTAEEVVRPFSALLVIGEAGHEVGGNTGIQVNVGSPQPVHGYDVHEVFHADAHDADVGQQAYQHVDAEDGQRESPERIRELRCVAHQCHAEQARRGKRQEHADPGEDLALGGTS
ncbi:hypothetical protein AAHB34_07060 [Paenarthrobacter ureafaciens]